MYDLAVFDIVVCDLAVYVLAMCDFVVHTLSFAGQVFDSGRFKFSSFLYFQTDIMVSKGEVRVMPLRH